MTDWDSINASKQREILAGQILNITAAFVKDNAIARGVNLSPVEYARAVAEAAFVMASPLEEGRMAVLSELTQQQKKASASLPNLTPPMPKFSSKAYSRQTDYPNKGDAHGTPDTI